MICKNDIPVDDLEISCRAEIELNRWFNLLSSIDFHLQSFYSAKEILGARSENRGLVHYRGLAVTFPPYQP